jgi:hypothetical protein
MYGNLHMAMGRASQEDAGAENEQKCVEPTYVASM